MVKASTELILAVVAATTGTTTFLGVILIFCVYFMHRRRQSKQYQQQQEQGDQHPAQFTASRIHNKQRTTNFNGTTIDTTASSKMNEECNHRNQNHLASTMIENQSEEIQGTTNEYKVGSKNDNAEDNDIVESNPIAIPSIVIRSISTSSSRSGTIAQGQHTSIPKHQDVLSTSNDHNKRTLSIGGFSLPISFGLSSNSSDEKVDKNGKEVNRDIHRTDSIRRDDKNNKKALVEQPFQRKLSTTNKKTSKGTILHPTPKSKSEKVKTDAQPKIRRFSLSSSVASIDPPSSSSSSSSSISYINSPSINEFSFRQSQNSIGQYNDDDSHDIHTFDDNWSYSMTEDGSQLLVTGGYSHMVNKRTGGAMFSSSPSIASNRMNSTFTGLSSLNTPSDTANRIETIKEAIESFTTVSTLETSPSSSSWATPHRMNTSSHKRSVISIGTDACSENNVKNDSNNNNNNMSMRPVVDSNGKLLFEV